MTAQGDGGAARYGAVTTGLHWLIALLIAVQIGLGWYMGDLDDRAAAKDIEHVHISLGLVTLMLSVTRVAWRLARKPPPLPDGMPRWERVLSSAVHGLFYVLILAIPLTGWAMESTGPRPIPFFGFEWPHAPFLGGLSREQARPLHETLEDIHGSKLVWTMIALIVLHVVGALKHQFDGNPVLYRMVPFLPRPKR